jgi:hypothetical protein
VQFFDHQIKRGVGWYLSQFPDRLDEGRMTGEASPGYMVYARVPPLVVRALPQVRIIAILREPLDRLWSSYHYNSVDVLGPQGRPAGLEHFVAVEMGILRGCLARQGYDARVGSGPNADVRYAVDFVACYDAPHNSPKQQVRDVRAAVGASDGKDAARRVSFPNTNPHLYRQFLGRGAYSLMLEHWFGAFDRDAIAILCTDDITAQGGGSLPGTVGPAATMRRVALFLGLDGSFDFEATVAKGKFNAAGLRGYDQVTPWGEAVKDGKDPMPLALAAALQAFYRPFNERAFELAGRRCPWPN